MGRESFPGLRALAFPEPPGAAFARVLPTGPPTAPHRERFPGSKRERGLEGRQLPRLSVSEAFWVETLGPLVSNATTTFLGNCRLLHPSTQVTGRPTLSSSGLAALAGCEKTHPSALCLLVCREQGAPRPVPRLGQTRSEGSGEGLGSQTRVLVLASPPGRLEEETSSLQDSVVSPVEWASRFLSTFFVGVPEGHRRWQLHLPGCLVTSNRKRPWLPEQKWTLGSIKGPRGATGRRNTRPGRAKARLPAGPQSRRVSAPNRLLCVLSRDAGPRLPVGFRQERALDGGAPLSGGSQISLRSSP